MTIVKPLYGHVSESTAYIVESYPFGFRLRCKLRAWLEDGGPSKGWRYVTQTTNPKRSDEVWNNPKRSTYSRVAGALYLDEVDHIHWTSLSEYSDPNEILAFIKQFPKADFRVVRPLVAGRLAMRKAVSEGKPVYKLNGVPQMPTEAEIEKAKLELPILEECQRLLAVAYVDSVEL